MPTPLRGRVSARAQRRAGGAPFADKLGDAADGHAAAEEGVEPGIAGGYVDLLVAQVAAGAGAGVAYEGGRDFGDVVLDLGAVRIRGVFCDAAAQDVGGVEGEQVGGGDVALLKQILQTRVGRDEVREGVNQVRHC